MALKYASNNAPHRGRTVRVGPNRRINLAQAGVSLMTVEPTTKLGRVALDLAVASSTATVQIIATTAYVNALTALSPPLVTFSEPPPDYTLDQLTSAYNTFKQQLAVLQGQASTWIAQTPNAGASVFSNLVQVTQMISNLDETIQGNFTILRTAPSDSKLYKDTLADTKTLIGVELKPLQSSSIQISTLQTALAGGAATLIAATTTGALNAIKEEYAREIASLQDDIDAANDKIASNNSKIIGLGFAAGAALVVGLIGVLMIWNPIGWFLMAGGAVGAYFAIHEIQNLKGQISDLRDQINEDVDKQNANKIGADAVALFASAAKSAADMNSAAQQELATLVTLCDSLAADIEAALADLDPVDLAAALDEWNDVVAASTFLAGITAYLWPSSIQLANPSTLAAAGSSAYLVANDGTAYAYADGGNTWTALPGRSLSVVAGGSVVAGLDGAPVSGTEVQEHPYGQTFYAKTYSASGEAWTTISDTPFAQLATDGTSIWGTSQLTNDRQIYKYSGSGSTWTALGAMPNSDVPSAVVASGGKVVAIANNANTLWVNAGGSWQAVGSATYASLNANGNYVSLVDSDNDSWIMDLSAGNSLTAAMAGVSVVAQAPSGDQYAIDLSLNLWHVSLASGGNPQSTQLRQSVVGTTVSDSGKVYALDNKGDIWMLTDLANNTWQQLPALPTT